MLLAVTGIRALVNDHLEISEKEMAAFRPWAFFREMPPAHSTCSTLHNLHCAIRLFSNTYETVN